MDDFANIWPGKTAVIGGGRFGRLALERMPGKVALVVEPSPEPDPHELGAPVWRLDGVEATRQMLSSSHPPKYIIPTLPVHLFARWLCQSLPKTRPSTLNIPKDVHSYLQLNTQCINNVLYVSLADFICPDDCPEPANICIVTGKPRGVPLFERMAALAGLGYQVAVARSHQLAPGIGGLAARDLLELRAQVVRSGGDWILATACKCHGALEYIRFAKSEKGIA